jgi:ferrous iron transport protein B
MTQGLADNLSVADPHSADELQRVVLVGNPNVGKSVVFGALTGRYVVVSNYPGTTVEVTKGKSKIGGREFEIIDTPGMYSFLPITEEERVARSVLLNAKPHMVLQVADAKNIERMLHMTLQLIEAGLPVVLDLNLMDEAEERGISIDIESLRKELGIPVVGTVATENRGMDELKSLVLGRSPKHGRAVRYPAELETAIRRIEEHLPYDFPVSRRSIALTMLQGDEEVCGLVREKSEESFRRIQEIVDSVQKDFDKPLSYVVTIARHESVHAIVERTTTISATAGGFREKLSRMTMHPIIGIPILLLVIYGFFEFVGVFGAQISVDWLENKVFGVYISPYLTHLVESAIPWRIVQDLFVHDYGIFTLGIRYAVAIILPIVSTFFIAFSLIEDTGYLPRLAMFVDRMFKSIGLNGRAVIPIVLGFGCDTMATIVTRTLETKRERILSTFLLTLAIPCSAQMGVILALLAGHPISLWIFLAVMTGNFLVVGYLTAQVMPGESPMFYMEVPPLRLPKLTNVMTKTYTRVEWYLREVIPLFILASLLIWVGRLTGLFDLAVRILAHPVQWIGLPHEASSAFLFGFFRRDYGAAGLYDLHKAGLLSGIPLVVSVTTMALFMPCIAQFAVIVKERGMKTALGMTAFIVPYAFIVGFLVNSILHLLGVKL